MTAATISAAPMLAKLQPFSSLGKDVLSKLLPLCRINRFVRGEDPFSEADWIGRVVYLVRGELKVRTFEGGVEVLVGGSGRALLPICRANQNPPSAKAITDVVLLSLDEDPLDVMVTWHELASMSEYAATEGSVDISPWHRMSGLFAVKNLTEGAFSTLPPANIETLLERFERIPVLQHDSVIQQGDKGDYYYLIERGRCRVTRLVAGATVELAELTEGEAFGEEALVANEPRNATVTMKTSGVLLRLKKADFIELLREPLLHRHNPAQALERVRAGATWIDVRFPAEFHQDGLPGAMNIPINDIRLMSTALDPRHEYITYCQTGRRSSAAAFLLSQRGIQAGLLDGGLGAFAAQTEQEK